jgi:two-component system, cell cycle sensor histidine kinase and response regulator CckA
VMPLQSPTPLLTDRPTTGPTSQCLLLVEDEQSLMRAFSHSLEKAGYEILEANDVAQALTLWTEQRERIALILTDVQMPGPPVEDLIARARDDSPAIPILLMSGEVSGGKERVQALLGSVDAFIPKPMRLDTLRVEVERQLAARLPA